MSEEAKLESIRSSLSSIDFIMEPNVGNLVKSYVQAGGKPNEVVSLLSDNYKVRGNPGYLRNKEMIPVLPLQRRLRSM